MKAEHTNRLIHETSPYLLQHSSNPVDWYPWGEEALQKAKREDKPILVSIGYAACHWCHVMERESFEDEETARLMNDFFINIKVDREERPDIDHIYMDAVQAMTGSGGWPLNVFLTPAGKPFYGGTYFPPSKAYNRSSWRDVLTAIHETYRTKKDEIEVQAEALTEHLQKSDAFGIGKQQSKGIFDKKILADIAANLLKSADKVAGGFGKAPKFPQTLSIQYLLRHYHYTGDPDSLKQALLSVDNMIFGGIYDQLGGGFARYSTDDQWLAPHFEKMLYDNALLVNILAEAFQLTGDRTYSQTIKHTLDFVARELMSKEGGFFSALDADSEGVEGKFYTWNKKEIDAVLGEYSSIFCDFYDVTDPGNWEHTNILRVKKRIPVYARDKGLDEDELSKLLENCRSKLMEQRSTRIRPQLDDKVLLGWNALMNVACSKAYAATGEPLYREMAIRNAAFLEASLSVNRGREWLHTYKNGQAKYRAFLDDYAFLIQAYVHLQEITGNASYLLKAKELTALVIREFIEEKTGFFFFTSRQQTDVIVRKKEIYDGATPSGNSTMAHNLHYLGIVFNETSWINQARAMTDQLAKPITSYPTSFGNWACLLQPFVVGIPEIAVTGKNALEVLPELLKKYLPNRIIQAANVPLSDFPLLQGKEFPDMSLIYVCKDYACQAPVTNVSEINCC